ncbi:unnamed protein product [Lymnaea stagnalis]|uniref:Uncharacterized protein n=1 Tax=Lymnaea stagnalis TaxID=6523 RepID=A0AAV2IKA9_LYMST
MRSSVPLLLLVVHHILAVNPGVKIRFTPNGIKYANKIFKKEVSDLLGQLSLPDLECNIEGTSFTLSHIRATHVTPLNSKLKLDPGLNGLTVSVRNFGMSLSMDWQASSSIMFVPIHMSGGLRADFTGVRLKMTLGVALINSVQVLGSSHCSADIEDLSLTFQGASSWIMNLIIVFFENSIKTNLPNEICRSVEDIINNDAAKKFRAMRVTAEIDQDFILDYGFIAPVRVTWGYLESQHKGDVYWKYSRVATPYTPAVASDWRYNSKMLYMWITEYTAMTLGYSAHTFGYLRYTVTSDKLTDGLENYLNTTCPHLTCAGTILPLLGAAVPHSQLVIDVRSTAAPEIWFSTRGVHVSMSSSMIATVGRSSDPVFTGTLTLYITGTASVRNQMIVGQVKKFRLKLNNSYSYIGHIFQSDLNDLLNEVSKVYLVPRLNDIAQKGIGLPLFEDVRLVDPRFFFQNGSIVVATNVQYKNVQ